MKLIKPAGLMTQPFAANYNPSYKGVGLKGHTGEDYFLGFKKEIKASVTGEVYSILNEHNPNTDKYRAVFQLVDDGEFAYEVSYGHIDTALCKEGDVVQAGQPIATEGNWGTCYSGGKLVTPEEKPSGAGSHLHFQVRKCIKVKKRDSKKQYIRNSEGYVKRKGYFFEVVDYSNGYNGCVDPTQFYTENKLEKWKGLSFQRDLKEGDSGYEVKMLQETLKELGHFNYPECTGHYGEITKQAVKDFQKKYEKSILWTIGLKTPTGYFGKSTRAKLNELLA